jgi:hypothetical protein
MGHPCCFARKVHASLKLPQASQLLGMTKRRGASPMESSRLRVAAVQKKNTSR